jgi:hypothetical protein
MIRFKHNKKRNTVFLFEVLIKELSKCILEKREKDKNNALLLIKEFFSKNSALHKEVRVYNSILSLEGVKKETAEKILSEAKKEYNKISKKEIYSQQSALIDKINKILTKEVYNNFVSNYRSMATVYQIFNSDLSPKKKVLLEESIIEEVTQNDKETFSSMIPGDKLVLREFIKNFNDTYGDVLEEQRELLNKYILSFADNGVEFKIYLNEEMSRLKSCIASSLELQEIKKDESMTNKTKKVLALLEGFRGKDIDTEMVNKFLQIQSLVKELGT